MGFGCEGDSRQWVKDLRRKLGGGELPVKHVGYHLDLEFRGCDFLCRRKLGTAAEKEGHF